MSVDYDINFYPEPNKGLSEWLVGPEVTELLEDHAKQFLTLYDFRLAQHRKSGTLQSSGLFYLDVGFRKNDRLVAVIDYNAPYAAAFEYGNEHQEGHHYFNEVLNLMGGYG